MNYLCSTCGLDGVRLWRPTTHPADATTPRLLCAGCARTSSGDHLDAAFPDQFDGFVPAVPVLGVDGAFYAFGAVPLAREAWWRSLPLRFNGHLAVYGELRDGDGNVISLQQSSSAEGRFAWLFIVDRDGNRVSFHPPAGKHVAPSPHLGAARARALGEMLLAFANGEALERVNRASVFLTEAASKIVAGDPTLRRDDIAMALGRASMNGVSEYVVPALVVVTLGEKPRPRTQDIVFSLLERREADVFIWTARLRPST